MSDFNGIDLRGRRMLHSPWSSRKEASYPCPAKVIINIISAFQNEGGSVDELCGLLGSHLPEKSDKVKPGILSDSSNYYSIEFYFYIVMFTKLLLNNPGFRYTVDERTQLDKHHFIIEKGPLEYPAWIVDEGKHCDGYLSILNLASMFNYVEEKYSPVSVCGGDCAEIGAQISKEALEILNSCTVERYRVERSFFNKEGILISFEYLFYGAAIFTALTNEPFFTSAAHYYGYLHSNLLARAIFLQPDLSPVEGFQQWQSRTNNVYKMEFVNRYHTLFVKLHLRKQIQTGMFDLYHESTIDGIKQAAPAVYSAFLELATNKKVRTRVIQDKLDKYSFTVKVRWRSPDSSLAAHVAAGAAGLIIFIAAVYSRLFLSPGMDSVITTAVPTVIALGMVVVALNWRNRLKRVKEQFKQSQDVISKQLDSLKETSNELLEERDALERKVRERTAELNKALEKLKQLDKSKTNFIANVSHELRTPLTLLSAPLESIRLGRYGESVPSDHPFFEIAARNVDRLKIRINQLLDLSRLDLGTMTFNPQQIEIISYCRTLAAELESVAAAKDLYLKMKSTSKREKVYITADKDLLETMLLNLLNNALKFTDKGGISLEISDSPDTGRITISVKDTGVGFPAEQKDRLFQRFTQAEEHEQRRSEGAGLGLALVKEIAQHYGWGLEAESVPGEGAAFLITFVPDEGERIGPSVAASVSNSSLRQERLESELFSVVPVSEDEFSDEKDTILLVEDNPDMGMLLQSLLEPEYNLHWCSGGHDALDCLKEHPQLSLIICDVMMPGMSGFDFRERLLQNSEYHNLPFIFLTALADLRDKTEGLESGAVDYIQKPFSTSELRLRVRNVIESHKASYLQAVRDRNGALRLSRNTAETVSVASEPDWLLYGITGAERKIVEFVRRGFQDKEIASELSLSPRTVSSHLSHLYQKTETQNRMELINLLYK